MTTTTQHTPKVPQLRFPGFVGEWEEKRLGEVVDFKNGKGHEQFIDENGKYIVINSKFISRNGTVRKYTSQIISPLQKGEITMVMSDVPNGKAIAKCFIVDENDLYTLNQRICALTPINMNSFFLFLEINRNPYYLRFDDGNTQTNLRKDEVLNCPIFVPHLPEQQKIADFLSVVDEKIESLEEKKKSLEEYKKGMMQKIFSQEVRFTGENGESFGQWEEKRLGEVATFSKGKIISKKDITEDGKVECIRYGELYTTYGETISQIESKTSLDRNLLVFSEGNEIIIPSSGETQLDIATASCVLKGGIAIGGDLNIIKSQNNGVFMSYYFNSAKKNDIAKLAQGNSVVHLYNSHLTNLKLLLPSLPEQQKIADFLSGLDEKIEILESEIEGAKEWKKGLLQGLFV